MRVLDSQIKVGRTFKAEGDVDMATLREYVDGYGDNVVTDPVHYEAFMTRKGKFIRLEAAFEVHAQAHCYRCLETVRYNITGNSQFRLADESMAPQCEEYELSEDELDIYYYKPPYIPLDDIIIESVILELNTSHLCSPACKGLCDQCGQNLNTGTCDCPEEV